MAESRKSRHEPSKTEHNYNVEEAIKVVRCGIRIGNPDPETKEWLQILTDSTKAATERNFCGTILLGRTLYMASGSMLLLMRESLLSHRWHDVKNVLHVILGHRHGFRHLVRKACNELAFHSEEDHSDSLTHLSELLSNMHLVSRPEVFLELILYLLYLNKYDDVGRLQLASAGKWNKSKAKSSVEYEKLMERICQGYVGVAKYTEFKESLKERHGADLDYDSDILYNTISQESFSGGDVTMHKASEAVTNLKSLIDVGPGCWDIFICKLHEIYLFMGEDEKALGLLQTYAASNPDNANTLRYLYEHHEKLHHKEEALVSLKNFCDAIPSDELGLVLYKKLRENNAPHSETLYVLFDLLDYGCWQMIVEPWELLATEISKITEKEDKEHIDLCWSIRSTWWPPYHFNKRNICSDSQVPELLSAKITVASVLCGESDYVIKARKVLEKS